MTRMMLIQLLDVLQVGDEWRYAWQEVDVDPATNEMTPVAGGRKGSTADSYAVIPGNVKVDIDPLDPPITPYTAQQRGFVENVMTWWAYVYVTGGGLTDYVAVFRDGSVVEDRDVYVRQYNDPYGNAEHLIVTATGMSDMPDPKPSGYAILGANPCHPAPVAAYQNSAFLHLLCPSTHVSFDTGYRAELVADSANASCQIVQQTYTFNDGGVNTLIGMLQVSRGASNDVEFRFTAFGSPTPVSPPAKAKLFFNGVEPVVLVNPNIWTGENTFQSINTATTPLSVVGAPGQTANPFQVTSGGHTAGVDNSGFFFGSGALLTNLNASQLTSGTVPPARIGVVDGGTW